MKFDTGSDRLEIFSDGVIAIAITLLVLDIKVPHSKDGQLVHDLLQNWPSYLAYLLSFTVIGIMWVSHHSMFERIRHVDRGLLFLNLWLLVGIAFLPFPTALLAEYVREGGSNSHAAAAIYSATMTLIGLAFLAIWVHLARRPHLLADHASSVRLRRSINLSLVSPVVYGSSIGLAFVSAEACLVVYALAAVYFAFGPSSRALSRLIDRQATISSDDVAATPDDDDDDDDELPGASTEQVAPVNAGVPSSPASAPDDPDSTTRQS